VAALPELWHICVFIEAGGMELGKLGGGSGGKCVCMARVCVCVCVYGWWWGSSGDLHVLSVWGSVRSLGRGKESTDKKGESQAERERGKLQILLYLQISCQKEPFKGNAPVVAL